MTPHDDYLGEEHVFADWDEFFADCERLHEKGVPYSLLRPAADLIERLGPMPTPPWEDRERAYQRMFDGFVHARGLDVEFDNWPADAERAWAEAVAEFNLQHPN
jgi:hypothetical protein